MSFTISYDIKAIDHFTATSEKICLASVKMDSSMRKMAQGGNVARRSFTKMDDVAAGLNKNYDKLKDRTRKIDEQLMETAKSTRKLTSATKSLASAEKAAAKAAKEAERNRAKAVATMREQSAIMGSAGRTLLTRVAAPMAVAGIASVKFANDFNKGMASVATLIPGQGDRIQELKGQIQDLAIETGTATGDLSAGAYAAISAWGDSAETIDRLRVVAKASKAGLASTEETLGLLSSMTEIYGDNSAAATERVADLAFVANKLGIKAPFAEMASSMGRVAPLAKQIGISQESLFATLAANAGVTGSVAEVSTQMASLYTSVIKTTPAMAKVVKKSNKLMGTSFKTAAEMMESIGTMQFLQMLKATTKGATGMTKALGGRKEGLILALSLLNSRSEKYSEVMYEMRTQTGQMAVAYDEVANGVNKSGENWEKTKQKMIVFAQRTGDVLLPVAEKVMDRIEGIIKWLGGLDDTMIDSALNIGKLAIEVGLLFTALSTINNIGLNVATLIKGVGSSASGGVSGIKGMEKAMLGLNTAVIAGGVAYAGLKLAMELWENHGKKTEEREEGMDDRHFAMSDISTKSDEELRAMVAADKTAVSQLPTSILGAEAQSPEKWVQGWSSLWNEEVLHPLTEANIQRDEASQRIATVENLLSQRRDKRESEAEMGMGGGMGSLGFNPYAHLEPQEVKVSMDINAPDGTVSNIKATTNMNSDVDLGQNIREI